MDAFAYLSVLISIILGLAITQILQGFRELMQARERLRMYWPALLWAILMLVVCIQEWWALFGWRDFPEWTFAGFSLVLAQVIATYLSASLVLPLPGGDAPIDLRVHYYANHRWFFALAAIAVAASIAKDIALLGHVPRPPLNLAALLALLILFGAAAMSPRERVHKLVAPLAALLFGGYIAVLFAHLR